MPAFLLPDLGEGLTEAEIVTWRVQAGDVVAVDQTVVEVETAKAVVEVPVPFAGRVTALHGEPGDVLAVGAPLITVAGADTGRDTSPAQDRGTGHPATPFAEPGVATPDPAGPMTLAAMTLATMTARAATSSSATALLLTAGAAAHVPASRPVLAAGCPSCHRWSGGWPGRPAWTSRPSGDRAGTA